METTKEITFNSENHSPDVFANTINSFIKRLESFLKTDISLWLPSVGKEQITELVKPLKAVPGGLSYWFLILSDKRNQFFIEQIK
jgi:hypothetical protein